MKATHVAATTVKNKATTTSGSCYSHRSSRASSYNDDDASCSFCFADGSSASKLALLITPAASALLASEESATSALAFGAASPTWSLNEEETVATAWGLPELFPAALEASSLPSWAVGGISLPPGCSG